jgi:uncharacterized protein (DUF433 family)
LVEAPGIEPVSGSTQLFDFPAQSQLAECGSNVDPAREHLSRAQREAYRPRVDWRSRITIEPGKRSGKPCIRGLRITVGDILEYLASGMSEDEILRDLPDLEREDIRAALAFAAAREERVHGRSVE